MTTCSVNSLYPGMKILQDNEPSIVIHNEFIKPGKGQAFNRVRLHKLISNKFIERIFKSGYNIKLANVLEICLVFLYKKGDWWYFIDKKSFEQFVVNKNILGNNIKWITEQVKYNVIIWDKKIITVIPPKFIYLKIINTDPFIKGDNIATNTKLAKLITGVVIKVPCFLEVGDIIKVNTVSGKYVSRIK
ncbi:MAG: elongation factor P [Candidatus Lightella neohaematopini]|nr:elongation factor P [Candidatus Lightella neohaematopini]